MRGVFQRARSAAPAVIFFDEFDAVAPRRQSEGNQVSERVVNTLLNEMSGFDESSNKSIFVIAATNRPDMIDPAVLRSGRLEKHIWVPIPSAEDRVAILASLCNKVQMDKAIDLTAVAGSARLEGCSGADLESLVKEAGLHAILNGRTAIGQADLDQALGKLRPSLSAEERKRYEQLCLKMAR